MDYRGLATALLVVCLCFVPVGAASVDAVASDASGDAPNVAVQESFDRNEVQLTVFENGSARWTFHYERTLTNETEQQNFESFATEFNANETPLYTRFQAESSDLVAGGENLTGREMTANDFNRRAFVTTSLGNDIGVVEMSFTWTNFAAQEGDRVIVGDVFEGGLYLGPQQSLVVSPGGDLQFDSVSPEGTQSNSSSLAASDSVTWQGEREFTDNRPRVVFVPLSTDAGGGGGTGDDGTTTTPAPTTPEPTSGSGGLWIVGLVGLVAVGGAAAWYLRRRETVDQAAGDSVSTAEPTASAGDTAGAASAAGASGTAGAAVSDEELLTDEDRVVSMLEDNGGRMKQVNIVDETGWSKSKVSMLLSEMEEAGTISKLRVGRENVISLAGHEPDATRSPFDDE
ncbi:hypothetical protein SAMN04487949_1380 [Halogranum gelatinilyticum]|uniref:IclR helix-turn-helix domain-containing protein n=1 Tax=Halogranum gelatinilyticum TaxID=660521 RepID=A0A1G9SJ49_9EURY|nr:hypothetical protein [Halogranum gelatinilyticum]SDM35327.1 hypothetical protein SAMN04487949_1380 [Halogranum gelatinilyticum]